MKLYIPDIGDVIKLKESWTFNLYHERSNEDVLKILGYNVDCSYYSINKFTIVTLPVDTELKIKRVYIRSGSGSYSSITFSINNSEKFKKSYKFWAKLKDVNRIEINSSSTLGIMKFPIKWIDRHIMPEKGTSVHGDFSSYKNKKMIGSINDIDSFLISVEEMETILKKSKWGRNVTRISKIKYKLVCLLNDEEIGQWSTISTMKNKAKEYIEHNKKYFLDDYQRIALREEKFNRILKDEK